MFCRKRSFGDSSLTVVCIFTLVKEADAMHHVAGFMVAHDVSARDWQLRRNGGQWLAGKTFDTFCPIGPAIVTRGAISGEDTFLIPYVLIFFAILIVPDLNLNTAIAF